MGQASSAAFNGRIPILRAAVACGAAFGSVFAICWVGAQLPSFGATHAYIALFTAAPISSSTALVEGTGWSVAFGAMAGGIFAAFYYAFGFLDGRGR